MNSFEFICHMLEDEHRL